MIVLIKKISWIFLPANRDPDVDIIKEA